MAVQAAGSCGGAQHGAAAAHLLPMRASGSHPGPSTLVVPAAATGTRSAHPLLWLRPFAPGRCASGHAGAAATGTRSAHPLLWLRPFAPGRCGPGHAGAAALGGCRAELRTPAPPSAPPDPCACRRRVADYPNLQGWMRDMMQVQVEGSAMQVGLGLRALPMGGVIG